MSGRDATKVLVGVGVVAAVGLATAVGVAYWLQVTAIKVLHDEYLF